MSAHDVSSRTDHASWIFAWSNPSYQLFALIILFSGFIISKKKIELSFIASHRSLKNKLLIYYFFSVCIFMIYFSATWILPSNRWTWNKQSPDLNFKENVLFALNQSLLRKNISTDRLSLNFRSFRIFRSHFKVVASNASKLNKFAIFERTNYWVLTSTTQSFKKLLFSACIEKNEIQNQWKL